MPGFDLLVRILSQMSRKRPRLLDEALSQDERVDLRFSDSFASDNENLLLLQVGEMIAGLRTPLYLNGVLFDVPELVLWSLYAPDSFTP